MRNSNKNNTCTHLEQEMMMLKIRLLYNIMVILTNNKSFLKAVTYQ